MAFVLDKMEQTYNYLFNELSHPLTKDWILIASPVPLFSILFTYNLFCISIGPMIMKNRPPYKLEAIIQFYNIFQVVTSLYLVYIGSSYMFSGKYNFQCEGPDEVPGKELQLIVASAFQVYFLLKIIELFDTVFFVLRKSYRQVTFLHLYHHTVMPIVSWIAVKYVPGGQPVIIGTINSLIHVFMYVYYYVSGLGPQYRKYLWWKKYLTMMQIVQFVTVLIHTLNSLFYPCSYSIGFKLLTILEAVTFIYMFSKFYYNSYIKGQKSKQDIKKEICQVENDTAPFVGNNLTDRTGHNGINGGLTPKVIKNGVDNKYQSNGNNNKNQSNGRSNGVNGANGKYDNKHKSKHL